MEQSVKTKKIPKWLKAVLIVVLVLAVLAATLFLVVYRGMHIWLVNELGNDIPDASTFMRTDAKAKYAKDYIVSLKDEGNYILFVDNGDSVRPVILFVRDTQAPYAKAKDVNITIDDKSLEAKDIMGKIKDASDFTVKWIKEPEYGKVGTYNCEVELKDSCGNSRIVKSKVNVLGLVDVLEHEAGTSRPTIDDFMVVERDNAKLVTDMNSIDWNVPGDYTVEAEFDGNTYSSVLRIVDTEAPVPDLVPVAVLEGEKVKADDFVMGSGDATEVKYEMLKEPVTERVGTVTCKISATDMGGNKTEVNGKVIVCDAIAEFEAENKELSESAVKEQIGAEYAGYKMQTPAFKLNSLGGHSVTFSKGGESIIVGVVVKDTVAPTAEGIECPCCTGYYCDPIKFAANIVDISEVKASFITEPDWNAEGEQDVEIRLTDRAGNSTDISATAVLGPDKTAPVIYAAKDRYCYVGEAVAYFKEVFAEDNADPDVELTVDKSKVNPKKAGEYDITYIAKDHEGNKSSKTVKFTFIEKTVDDKMLDKAVQGVLDEILTDDMTKAEKALAIYNYAYEHILYNGESDKTDWKAEAYRGITEGVGDCFTFYSTSYALLQKIDCQVLTVERLNGKTQHFWCMVNLGNGWYHFDTCNVGPDHARYFMKTTDELKAVSTYFWRFDEAIYPAGATRAFSMD